MTPLDFILQKTKALKEARGKIPGGIWHSDSDGDVWSDAIDNPPDQAKYGKHPVLLSTYCGPDDGTGAFTALAANEITRFADALEVLAKALSKAPCVPARGKIEECYSCSAIAQAAGILRGEE